jgi:predicted RNA-binding protein with PIN domain
VPLILDGNNLLHRLADRSRASVRRLVLEATRHETVSMTVVFDGPPPAGSPARESLGRVTIVYASSQTADDVIVRTIPAGAAAKQWTVITDDRGLAERVKERGAMVRSLAQFRGRRKPAAPARTRAEAKLSSREVAEWEEYFSGGSERRNH